MWYYLILFIDWKDIIMQNQTFSTFRKKGKTHKKMSQTTKNHMKQ